VSSNVKFTAMKYIIRTGQKNYCWYLLWSYCQWRF